MSDFEVALLSSTEPVRPLSLAAFEAMHERFVSENVTDAVGFALEVNGDLVGTCGLHAIDHFNSRCEVGIAIGRDHWGRGLGQDAVRTLVRYAFDHLNMHRVALYVLADDPRAVGAYRKAGFTEEGRLREQDWVRGAYHDVLVMSVLREESRPL